jgi:hypothetical protein
VLLLQLPGIQHIYSKWAVRLHWFATGLPLVCLLYLTCCCCCCCWFRVVLVRSPAAPPGRAVMVRHAHWHWRWHSVLQLRVLVATPWLWQRVRRVQLLWGHRCGGYVTYIVCSWTIISEPMYHACIKCMHSSTLCTAWGVQYYLVEVGTPPVTLGLYVCIRALRSPTHTRMHNDAVGPW